MTARFIAVAGNIGAGKSTLVRFLARRFRLHPLYEPVEDNPYLADFYADMKRWAFPSQIFYLTRKYALHLEAQRSERRVVLDRTVYEDADIFAEALRARRLLTTRDWRTYRDLFEVIRSEIEPPDLLIYLRCSVRGLRRRIRQRGRDIERDVPARYLRGLNQRYERWFAQYEGTKAILETEKIDYVTDLVDRVDLIERVEALLGGPTLL